jgi:hypothetical protein
MGRLGEILPLDPPGKPVSRRTRTGPAEHRPLRIPLAAWALALALIAAGCGSAGSARHPAGRPAVPGDLAFSTAGWRTDFTRHAVPLSQLASGGPPRDGIPPIDRPRFVTIDRAARFLDQREPVLAVEIGGRARAYPQQILIWHEIVNDTLAARPIVVSYCPLCNSSLVFDRRVAGRTLTFGTTGNLRHSDLVMWDRQTQSWWQQFTGDALVGALTGAHLTPLGSQTLSFADFRARYPDGQVLSRHTGFDRPYGTNPYVGYDDPGEQPFLLDQRADRRLPPKERVLSLLGGARAVVVPFSRLQREPVIDLDDGGGPVVAFYRRAVKSSLDAGRTVDSRDVGTATAFDRRLDGRSLTFSATGDGVFRDRQTGSSWDVTGVALSGPLAGRRLVPVRHDVQFWFAVAAFVPDVRILR